MSLVAHDESSEVLEPSEEPLDLPTSLVATKASPIFELPTSSTTSLDVRRDETNALLEKLRIERIAVVGLVADERVRQLTHEPLFDHLLDELGFVGRSASNANGERKTRAVCDCHDLGPLAALGFADAEPPFLALSIKLSGCVKTSAPRAPVAARCWSSRGRSSRSSSMRCGSRRSGE